MALHRRRFLYGILSVPAGGLLARGPRAGLTATVYNGFELDAALAAAGPGSAITLAPGHYGDIGRFVLAGSGVSVRVQSPLATVLHAPLVVEGHAGSLAGLAFEQGVHLIGNGLTIANSSFVGHGIEITGVNVEVANCDISQFQGRGIIVKGTALNPHIHHNHIHDSVGHSGSSEAIQVGQSMHDSNRQINAVVEYNLLERINGEDEAMSIKSTGNMIRNNTLSNSVSYISNRHGENNTYSGNTIQNAYGIVIQDRNNKVIGNRCVGLPKYKGIRINAGSVSADSTADGQWPQAVNTVVSGNTADLLVIGETWGKKLKLPAIGTAVSSHSGPILYMNQTGTTVNGAAAQPSSGQSKSKPVESAAFDTPPALTRRDVGPKFA